MINRSSSDAFIWNVGAIRADGVRCSMIFTQVAVHSLTDLKIKAGLGSEFFRWCQGKGWRGSAVLLLACDSACLSSRRPV